MKFAGYIGHLWVAFQNSYNDKILLDTRGRSIYMSKAEAKELREKLNVFIGDE